MLIYLAVITSFISFAASQSQPNFEILPNGTLVLAPPPDSITGASALPTFNNPVYLDWLYSASDGFIFGITRGISPILTTVLENTNSCIATDILAFQRVGSASPTLFTDWLIGFVILGVFGLVCGLSLCITCIVVCCCRVFCKRCGAEDSQNITAGCTGINLLIWTPILLLLLAVTLVGCVFGILSYVSFNGYISNLPNNVDTSLGFLSTSISGIVDQLNFTIVTQLNSTLEGTIRQVRGLFDTSFGNRLNSLANELNGTVTLINQLVVSVNMLNSTLASASNFVTDLNNNVSSISTRLSNLRTECMNAGLPSSECNMIPNSISTNLMASSIPDISSEVAELNMINTTEIADVVANISTRVDAEINTLMGYFTDLDVLGNFDLSSFTSVTETLRQSLNNFSSFDSILRAVRVPPSQFNQGYEIAYKILLAISIILFCLILVVIILSLIGAIITLVSYDHEARPSMRKPSSNCGANLLALSGYAGLCVTWILAPILVALFVFGSLSSTVCQPLVDRSLLRFATSCIPLNIPNIQVGDFGTFDLQLNITRIFESCENNENLLQAFQADALTDIILMNITALINSTIADVRTQIDPNVISTGITDSYNAAINTYDTSQYDFNAANDITNQLNTTEGLQQIDGALNSLQSLITQIDDGPSNPQVSALRANAVEIMSDINTLRSNLVLQVGILNDSTISALNMINNNLTAINTTLIEASSTVNQFASNLSALTTGLIDDSVATLDSNVMVYTNYIRDNFPRCNFIPGIYNAFTDVTCRGIISNFNVYWFCLGWALVFLVISSIFSFVVARYGVRRDHEKWFESEHDEQATVPVGGPRITTEPDPTAPAVFQNQQQGFPEQPPPVYTANQDFEMKRYSQTAQDAPVLMQLNTGPTAPPTVW